MPAFPEGCVHSLSTGKDGKHGSLQRIKDPEQSAQKEQCVCMCTACPREPKNVAVSGVDKSTCAARVLGAARSLTWAADRQAKKPLKT